MQRDARRRAGRVLEAVAVPAGGARARGDARPGLPRLPRCSRAASTCRTTSAARATFTLGQIRRPRGPRAAHRRRAARRRRPMPAPAPRSSRRPRCPRTRTTGRSACSTDPTARPTSSPTRTSRRFLRHRLAGALQLQPHRRPPDRPEAAMGAHATAARPACIRRTSTTTPTPIGAIDFTGDMPVILGPDGPSLGGFVCPGAIVAGRALEDRPAQRRRSRALRSR